jgi:high affinity cGMP-specific 3',5'-cyclic phosphodiesterase 9
MASIFPLVRQISWENIPTDFLDSKTIQDYVIEATVDLGLDGLYDPACFSETVRQTLEKYNDVPFHNKMHAFGVTMGAYLLLRDYGPLLLTPVEQFGVILAALVHDIDHPGLDNAYQTNAQTELATKHGGGGSVLEKHHASTGLRLFRGTGIFGTFDKENKKHICQIILTCILATDMAGHGGMVKELENYQAGNSTHEIPSEFLCALMVHAADLSGQLLPFRVADVHGKRMSKEFTEQVSKEIARGMDPTPSMHNLSDPATYAENQKNFCQFVLIPFWDHTVDLLENMRNKTIKDNPTNQRCPSCLREAVGQLHQNYAQYCSMC